MKHLVFGSRFKSAFALRLFPDETVGSVAARYHLLSCNVSTRRSLFEMFGCRGFAPNSSLPSRLAYFAGFVRGTDSPADAHAVAASTTLLSYFTFFWCRDAAARLANEMVAAAYPKASAGLLASTFGASDSLKYCGMCVIDDTKTFGVPYWHRVHQLPEVVICPRHMILLQERLRSADLLDRHALPLPPDERNSLPTPQVNPALLDMQLRFAKHSAALLELDQHYINPGTLQLTYQSRLIEKHLAKRSGRIDQVALREELSQYHHNFEFLPHSECLRSGGSCESSWLERIVRKPRTRQHPVLHLLLVDFLFGGPENLMLHFRVPLEKRRPKALCVENYEEKQIRHLLIERGLSLRAAAKQMGRTVAFVRVRAKALSLHFRQNPRQISDELEKQIFNCLWAGSSIAETALAAMVSAVSVYRIVQADPVLKAHIERRKLDANRSHRRERFAKACTSDACRVKTVGKVSPADYAWLMRNDRDWLKQFLESQQRGSSNHRARVDWSERDTILVSKLRCVVHKLLVTDQRPVRITVSELGRRTRSVSLLQKKLYKLPQTSAYLASAVETTLEYQKRRIEWAIATSGYATVSAIARKAGINDLKVIEEIIGSPEVFRSPTITPVS